MFPLQQFLNYIKKNALFAQQDKILLAVSGGKDSVLMVQLFKLAGFQFSIAHCNFNLRGDEAQRDEAFVKLLSANMEVPFYVAHFDTKAYAHQHQVSIQMAARELRYAWFEKVRIENGYDAIALAHQQNDSIETLLLNLTRGTGISGMHGILPKRDCLVRPLLFLSREEIDELVERNRLDFVEDSSNESTKYARNKIRHTVIPQLKEINPNLTHTFAQNMARFAETEQLLQQVIAEKRIEILREENGNVYLSIEKIKALSPRKLIVFELLKPYHFSNDVVDEILDSLHKQSGTSFYSHTHRLTLNRTELMLSTLPEKSINGPYFIHPNDTELTLITQKLSISYVAEPQFEGNSNTAYVDVDKLIFPLIIRFKQDGDKFMPLGMKHYKKLSDFLIDNKVPLPEKEKIPLLINGNGEIIWVVGLRQDNRYKVKVTTKKVAIFELLNP